MPRQAAVSVEEIFAVLKHKDIYLTDGTLKSRKDKVWKKASRILEGRITPNTLRFYVSKNWKNLRQKLKSYYNLKGNCGFTTTGTRLVDRCLEMRFDMSIPKEKWDLIKPVEDEAGKKRMRKGWARHVAEVMLDRTELPCSFTMLRGVTYRTNNDFKFSGNCPECGNPITGSYFFQYGMHGFEIATRNTKNIVHKQRLQISPAIHIEPEPETSQIKCVEETSQSVQDNAEENQNDLAEETQTVEKMEETIDTREIQNESQSEDHQDMDQTDEITATYEIQNETPSVEVNGLEQVHEIPTTHESQDVIQCDDPDQVEQIHEIRVTHELQHEVQFEEDNQVEQIEVIEVPHELHDVVQFQETIEIDHMEETPTTIEIQNWIPA